MSKYGKGLTGPWPYREATILPAAKRTRFPYAGLRPKVKVRLSSEKHKLWNSLSRDVPPIDSASEMESSVKRNIQSPAFKVFPADVAFSPQPIRCRPGIRPFHT